MNQNKIIQISAEKYVNAAYVIAIVKNNNFWIVRTTDGRELSMSEPYLKDFLDSVNG